MEHACVFIGQRTAGEEIYPALAEALSAHRVQMAEAIEADDRQIAQEIG